MNTNWQNIKQLSDDELVVLEKEYREILSNNPTERERVWKDWNNFFAQRNAVTDWDYSLSFFRWYTDLTWRSIFNLPQDILVSMVVARQIPTALWLGHDVWQELMFYFDGLVDPELIEKSYLKVREAFFNSEAIVGEWQGKKVRVADIVADVKTINHPGADSMKSAEVQSRIKQILVQSDDGFVFATPDEVFDRLVGLVNFFLGVEPKDVWLVVDAFVNPEKYEKEDTEKMSSVATKIAPVEPVVEQTQAVQTNYVNIKNMIEARFTRDASGEFVNLDGVLAFLETMATEQGDEAIRDLYYYDEGVGKFQWNEALLM